MKVININEIQQIISKDRLSILRAVVIELNDNKKMECWEFANILDDKIKEIELTIGNQSKENTDA